MKHCKNCDNCQLDRVAQYVKGADIYKCVITGELIQDPFWDKCEKYSRDFRKKEKVGDILFQLCKKVI